MGAIFPDEVKIYVVAADIDGTALATSDAITSYVTNYKKSGGNKDTEQIVLFGGANLEKEMPREQFEVSFDVIPQYGADATLFDEYVSGTALTSAGEAAAKAIFIEATDGTYFYTIAMNNCKAVTWEPENAADDYLKGTITFKFNATTSAGTANYEVSSTASSTHVW